MIISELNIELIKSNRKTISIHIERDGTISARVPEKMNDDDIFKVLKSKEYQIHKNLAQWVQLNDSKVEREYITGQSFLYFGRNYRLKIVNEDFKEVIFSKGYFFLSNKNKERAKELFVSFYKEKLKEKLGPIINQYKKLLNVSPNEVKVMELQNRWASCTNKGNVNFHWKCAMAPSDVLNYIVAHELIHLIHQNHTKEFWNELDKVMPNYEKQKKWLKVNGVKMDL